MNSMKSARVLLDSKAKLDCIDNTGSTALHYAVMNNHLEMIVLLLDRNANAEIKDAENVLPIEIVSESKVNIAKAILLVFLRHYVKKGLTVPKQISDKVGFTPTSQLGNDIGNIMNHRQLGGPSSSQHHGGNNNSRASSPTPSSATNATNYRPFSGKGPVVINENEEEKEIKPTVPVSTTSISSNAGNIHLPMLESLNIARSPPSAAAVNHQPITIYDQLNKPTRRNSFLSGLPGGFKPLTANDDDNVSLRSNRFGMGTQENASITSASATPGSATAASGKRRRLSVITHNTNATPAHTSSSAAAHASSEITKKEALSILGFLETNNKEVVGTGGNKSPSNSPSKPRFMVRKLENPLDFSRSDSNKSLRQLIRDMDTNDDNDLVPEELTSKRKTRKGRKIAQSMSVVPTLPLSIEDFLMENMKETEKSPKNIAKLTSQKTTPDMLGEKKEDNNISPVKKASVDLTKARRHASAPDIIMPTEVTALLEQILEEENTNNKDTMSSLSATKEKLDITPRRQSVLQQQPSVGKGGIPVPVAVAAVTALPPPNFVEIAYPPADVIPFLPSPNPSILKELSPDHLDVVIAVEHCCDCHLHNDQSLRHNVTKYVQTSNAVLFSLIRAFAQSKLAIRLYAVRCKPLQTPQRLGALEVTIAVRINLPNLITEHPVLTTINKPGPVSSETTVKETGKEGGKSKHGSNNPNPPPGNPLPSSRADGNGATETVVTMVQQRGHVKWATHKLFSKLETKRLVFLHYHDDCLVLSFFFAFLSFSLFSQCFFPLLFSL
jgi:ankyrin repeat protein